MHARRFPSPLDDWKHIDSTIVLLASRKGELDAEVGRWLLVAQRAGVHRHLGFASFAEYIGRRFGCEPKTVREKVRVATALESLPELRARFERGERSWCAVREISRVATAETEREWIDKTERMTVAQIQHLVSRRDTGDGPSSDPKPPEASYRLVFQVSAEEYADYLAAAEHVRKEIGPNATQRDVLRAMIQKELGQRAETQPAYQTTTTVCIGCARAWREEAGRAIEVPASVGARARCDCKIVGATIMEESENDEAPVPMPHVGRRSAIQDLRAAVKTGGAPALLHLVTEIFAGPFESLPPSLRAAVLARDHHRCVVPGCTNFRFIDVHHLVFRVKKPINALDNLVTLCTQHHDLLHDGHLAIEGKPSTGLTIRHEGGTAYGAPATAGRAPE